MTDSFETIKQDIEYIKDFIKEDREHYKDHVTSAQIFRDRVIKLEERVDGHSSEHVYYRWLFGIIIAVGLALLNRMY